MTKILETKNLKKSFSSRTVVNEVNLNLAKGEIVGLLGPNGAGKSTAMKAMLGLLKLKSGSITIDEKDISKLSPQDRVKQGISFVPQTRNVFAELTVKENLEIGAFLRTDDIYKVIDEIYDLFPILKEKKDQIVGQLSGGQRQRLALARALAPGTSIVVLDEPFSNIDQSLKEELQLKIKKILNEINISTIIVTHDSYEAFYMGNKCGIILNESLKQFDIPYNIYHYPNSAEVVIF